MSLTLYVDSIFASPWALSVFVALTEKGLPFSVETVDLESGQNKLPAYRELFPADVRQRARARQVQSWLRSDLAPVRAERNTETVFFKHPIEPLSADGQASAAKLLAAAERLIDGQHLFGQWSIADTDLTMMLNRLILNGDPVPERIKQYAAAQWQRPSVQQWLARHQPQ